MQLIRDVPNLGLAGQVVSVRPGQMRYNLLPRKDARYVVKSTARLQDEPDQIFETNTTPQVEIDFESLKEQIIAAPILAFSRRTIEASDNLHGSVSSGDIANALRDQGITVDKALIRLPDDRIKTTGQFECLIELPSESIPLRIMIEKAE